MKKVSKILCAKTRDAAFQFRMGAGYAGDVSRTHPMDVMPTLIDRNAPPTAFGQAVVVDAATSGVRPIVAGDSALTAIYGIIARPFPMQQAQAANNYGATQNASGVASAIAPPTQGETDVLVRGFALVQCNNFAANPPVKGGQVYIWYAASSGNHVQGGFEAAATGGSTLAVGSPNGGGAATYGQNAYWNSGPDANGIAEIAFNI